MSNPNPDRIITNGKVAKLHCPFRLTKGCSVAMRVCKYSLTEIYVPKYCPLREKEVTVSTTAKLIPSPKDKKQ